MKMQIEYLIVLICCCVFCSSPLAIAQAISYYSTGEEFSGPLPSWKNIKTDFGAKGDGITDDALAITAALSTFRDLNNTNSSVLYFPAGIYRLCSTILNPDRNGGGADYSGFAIVGEDPSNTILLWDGPEDGTMFRLDGWYMKLSRLTFDGQSRAKIGLLREGGFGTGVEYSDLIFKDLFWGVQMGNETSAGQAENLFLRCRFFNCDCAIYGPNMNSLDTWLWYCLFQDCNFGVHCGGYQAYGNVFLRSKVVDIGLSWQPSCIVNNISVNTECFNKYSQCAGLFQGNEIYDPDTTIIRDYFLMDTIKAFIVPYISVLLDNIVKTGGNAGAAIELCEGRCISVGNTFTQLWPVRPKYKHYSRDPVMYSIYHVVDGNDETLYGSAGDVDVGGIAWHCPLDAARIAVKYSLTTTGNWGAIPKSIRLVGSNDWGYHVTVLDTQENLSMDRGETRTFTFINTEPFSMYRLEVLETNDGAKPAESGWFELAEFLLFDSAEVNILNDPEGFLAGGNEIWGKYYSLQEKQVPYDSIAIPSVIELPGPLPLVSRKIFEVQKGTPDDAAEIQMKIDSAAAMLAGSRPIVHIPKGIYNIKKTIIFPANVEMTLSGDGLFNGGTILISDPNLAGSTLRIAAPSHLLIRDIMVEGDEAIYSEVDDKSGSRVTGTLFMFGGSGGGENPLADTAMIIDGIEQSYILFIGAIVNSFNNGVLVKGGPVLSSGGSTGGQIAFLSGASGNGQSMWNTKRNGKLIAQGMWYEAYRDYTKSFIDLTEESNGSMAIAGMQWGFTPKTLGLPVVSIDNFKGQFTTIANNFSGWDEPQWWQIAGDGAQARILSACNGWFLDHDSAALASKWPYWFDQTSPPAEASRIFCEGPDITNKIMNELPDSSSLLSSLELMRSLKIKKPIPPSAEDSHLDFIRVHAYCDNGGVPVRFVPMTESPKLPESPTLVSPINGSMVVATNPVMNWNSSANASAYHLQISISATFDSIVFEDSTIIATEQQIDQLTNNTVYYWRVLAINEYGNSAWSYIWNFTTYIMTSIEQVNSEIPAELYLGTNYPNPFCLNTCISYTIPFDSKVTFMVFDILGQEIEILVNEQQTAGKHAVKIDGSNLSAGIYFYRLQVGEYSATKKMVLIK